MFLTCAWLVLYSGKSPDDVMNLFRFEAKTLPPFHDASPCKCSYKLTVLDCLKGLEKARKCNFFDYDKFNVDEYEYFEQVENGDLNWIIMDKILAFAGPQNRREVSREGYHTLTPNSYIPYFQRKRIGLVVRLNKKLYEERKFTDVGIDHFDQIYPDGSCPPMHVLQNVITAFEAVPDGKGFAVHCKAGLGRTGTCIGAYIMKHYKFSAAEVIGWMRICRPGMVIGPQQKFLQDIEEQMWYEGDIAVNKPQSSLSMYDDGRNSKKVNSKRTRNILSKLPFGTLTVDDHHERLRGIPGQADGLLERKVHIAGSSA